MRVPGKTPVEASPSVNLLTVCETAWELRSSVDLVYRLIARGELACTSVGGKRLVMRKEIAAYLTRQTTLRKPMRDIEKEQGPVKISIGLKESGLWDGTDY